VTVQNTTGHMFFLLAFPRILFSSSQIAGNVVSSAGSTHTMSRLRPSYFPKVV
jgi:hypothetical protein